MGKNSKEDQRRWDVKKALRYRIDPEYRAKRQAASRKQYYKNRDAKIAAAVKWAQENPDKVVVSRLKFKRKNYPIPTRPEPLSCEICGTPSLVNKRLCLDHCHKDDTFRGWICSNCNIGLGNFKDDPKRLERAAQYIRENGNFLSGPVD